MHFTTAITKNRAIKIAQPGLFTHDFFLGESSLFVSTGSGIA